MTEEKSISSLQKSLLQGSTELENIVSQFLDRIKTMDPSIHAFNSVYEEDAMRKAEDLSERLKKNDKLGKLFGAVISVKDNICYKGHPTTASSRILEGFKPTYSATAIDRLIDEDAIIIGSTNCDEFGMGSTNENSYLGPVRNPLKQEYVAGGSSGGAAASVSAGFCHTALGSDTGGSVRQPASFCGVPALKPTYGRVSRYGLMAYASSFDQIGLIGNNIDDLQLVLSVVEGPDEFDSSACSKLPKPFPKKSGKVALLWDDSMSSLSKESLQKLHESAEFVSEKTGFKYLDYLVPVYYIIAMAEASSNLSRYDGAHYGFRKQEIHELDEMYIKTRTEAFGKEVKKRIMMGSFILSAGHYDAYYHKAQKVRSLIIEEVNRLFEEFEFLISPVADRTAFSFSEKKDPLDVYKSDVYTVLANICGIPAVTIPFSKDDSGMPFGIQIHARQFEENKLLDFAKSIMKSMS